MTRMESLAEALYEDPLYIYVSLGFAELVLAAVWHERRTRRWALALLGGPILAAAVFLIARAVVTDREQIIQAIREIARDVESGGVEKLKIHLDDDFAGDFGSKDDAIRAAAGAVRTYNIKYIRVGKPVVKVSGDQATMRLATVVQFSAGGVSGQTSLLWNVRWIKRGLKAWRIQEVDRPKQGLPMP